MGFQQSLEKSLTKFGANNSPTVVAMGIATAKGIFRPIFTMADKKESYETKKYTAIREGLTELIAIPIYYLSGVASGIIAEKLAKPKNFMSKKIYKEYKSGNTSEEIMTAVTRAEQLAKENLPKLKITTSFVGVALSALLIIPMVCSATIKPIMNCLDKSKRNKTPKDEVKIYQKPEKEVHSVQFNGYRSSYGMKVGGV